MVFTSFVSRRWTAEDDALLHQLFEKHESLPVIAAQLKRTMAAVEMRARFLRAQSAFKPEPKAEH